MTITVVKSKVYTLNHCYIYIYIHNAVHLFLLGIAYNFALLEKVTNNDISLFICTSVQ